MVFGSTQPRYIKLDRASPTAHATRDAAVRSPHRPHQPCGRSRTTSIMGPAQGGTIMMIETRRHQLRAMLFTALLVLATVHLSGTAFAGALDRIHQDNLIRIAYRADAPPFSFKNGNGEPAGFMVELCQAVARQLAQQLKLPTLE